MIDKSLYPTSDPDLAAWLFCKGVAYAERTHKAGITTLYFEGQGVETEARKFYNGQAKVDAKAYADALKRVRALIRQNDNAKQ